MCPSISTAACTEEQMGTQQQQAHKLITVSLEKIALGRRKRSEMSLHKNLLVTTVIHKAKLAIITEDRHYIKEDYEDYPVNSEDNMTEDECAVRELKRCHQDMDDDDAMDEESDVTMDDAMDWPRYENAYEMDEEANKENLSCLSNQRLSYGNKRLKTCDQNEMYDADDDDNTSHTLRLVSVLSATLSQTQTNVTSSRSSSSSSEVMFKQSKDSVDIALLVNRPAVIAAA